MRKFRGEGVRRFYGARSEAVSWSTHGWPGGISREIVRLFERRCKGTLMKRGFANLFWEKCKKSAFLIRGESNYKKTKDSIISDNSTKLKKIENENKDIEKSIKALNVKENSLKNEIHDLAKKEKQLSEKIKKVLWLVM